MCRVSRVKKLIEILEQYPEDALVTVYNGSKIKPMEVLYLQKRNIIVLQEYIDKEKKSHEIEK